MVRNRGIPNSSYTAPFWSIGLNERQLEVDFGELSNIAREITAAESQGRYGYCHTAQPSIRPPSTPGPLRADRRLPAPSNIVPATLVPRPYYHDDSAISIADQRLYGNGLCGNRGLRQRKRVEPRRTRSKFKFR